MERSEINAPNEVKDENLSFEDLTSIYKFGSQFVNSLNLIIQDVSSAAKDVEIFYEVLEESFNNILRLSPSITQFKGPATDLLRTYVDNLHKKIGSIAENVVMQDSEALSQEEMKTKVKDAQKGILLKVAQLFAVSLRTSSNKNGLTHHSAHLIINFVIRVLQSSQQVSPRSCPKLNIQLVEVADRLFYLNKNNHFHSDNKLLFSFIVNASEYDEKIFVDLLTKSQGFNSSRVYMLGLICLHSKNDTSKVQKYLAELCEQLVFNDKNKEAIISSVYFEPFYQSLNEKSYLELIHSSVQFCMNRSGTLAGNIASLVNQFKFKISSELATQLTEQILTRDYLIQYNDEIFKLFKAICQQLADPQKTSKKLHSYLLGEYEKVKNQATISNADKLKILRILSLVSNELNTDADSLATQTLELIFNFKEQTEIDKEIQKMLSRGTTTQKFIHNSISKIQFASQIQNLIGLKCLDDSQVILQKLNSTNFEIAANTSTILAMMRYVCEAGQSLKLLENEGCSRYLLYPQSLLNQTASMKKLSENDVVNHLRILQSLLVQDIKPQQSKVLTTFVIEYLVNQDYVFRGAALQNCFALIKQQWSESHLTAILQEIFQRVQKIYSEAKSEVEIQQSCSLDKKIRNFLSVVLPKEIKLEQETFISLIQLISHPLISVDVTKLKQNANHLQKSCKVPTDILFKQHSETILNKFLRERTGILSPISIVRDIAKNILILYSWSGQLGELIPKMMPIFNYKPIEMIDKLEKLLNSEFERISHYDLLFYSEMTKDMLNMYKEQDEKSAQQTLFEKVDVKQKEENKDESQISIEASDDMDPSILAMLSKASKGKKTKAKAAPAKTAPQKTTAPVAVTKNNLPKQEISQVPEMTKEERNRQDRAQMMKFVSEMREVKARQIRYCLQIIRAANQYEKAAFQNYLDLTFQYLTLPLLKLLYLTATKFDSYYFIQNLLNEAQYSILFKFKGSLLTGLVAIADNKLSSKAVSEIQACLHKLDQDADFGQMGSGTIQVCLTIANFVLKDPSVNLSVKEVALTVAQSILTENNVVQMIDLVRLTINMLKTNYISNNLSGFLKKLLRRTTRVEIALLLQPLFEYQPVPRKVLLSEIYLYDEPLFCPVWFSTLMWVLLFDEDLGSLSRKIFNKFGLTLRIEALELEHEKTNKNVFHYLRDENFGIFSLTTKAVGAAIEMFRLSPRLNKLIQDLIDFYDSEWVVIEQESNKAIDVDFSKDLKTQTRLLADQRTNRIAVPQIFERTAKLLQPQHFEKVLLFLITKGCQDSNEEVKNASAKAALALIKQQGQENANTLLAILESILNLEEDAQKNQAVILIGHLAQYLGDTAQKKLLNAFDKLMDLLLKSSPMLQRSICKCIPQLAKFFPEKAKTYLTNNLKTLRESKDEKAIKVSAYGTAGLLKCLGMQYMVEIDVIGIISKESFDSKKTEPIRKQAGLLLFDSLAFSMGRSFEVFLDKVFPLILGSISDQKEQVRAAALAALKTIMGMFSNFAIKQALPQFLQELKNDNWRSKFSTVEALGNMAFCAPKQISSFLPQIVKGLREVLNDTHEKVHEAAIEAIKKIGSVIKCPEIGDMLEVIIKALSNTNTHLNEALNLMLETSFAHSIDAPSLSLLVPLLDAGLTMHDNTSKQMAAQLMGNICSLTQDPQDLLPYMSILVPAIKQSLFDAIPEIRASAAKALGRLSRGLGAVHSVEMLGWLSEHLDKQSTSSSEKSGAAQGFAEMISSHGTDYFEKHIQVVIAKAQDKENYLREAYRGVLVFLPGCFDKYVDYLPTLVPIMIEGLADEVDEVRKVSMRNVKICIKQFAKTAPNQLVHPVMRMMFSTDFRVRESSSILMFQLVKELENDVIKAQPKYIDMDTKQKILSSMFILKYDPIEKVYTQAGQIWKSIVDNQLIVLRQVIDTCIQLVFQIIQSPSYELQEMGLSCIRGIVEKMGEKLVTRAIEIFESLLDNATEKTQSVGICKVIFNMAGAASYRLLQTISHKLVTIMDPYLSAESEELREWSSRVFITLFQRQSEKSFVDPILEKSILGKLKTLIREGNESEASRLITTLKYMVEKAAELKIEDRMLVLCDITDKNAPFSIAQARIIKALASTFAEKVFSKRFYFSVLTSLQEELNVAVIDDAERIQNVLMAYAELISQLPENEALQTNEEITKFFNDCQSNKRPGFYIDLIGHYCANTKTNFEKLAETYLDNCLKYMNFPDEKLVAKVIAAMNAIMERIPKENQMLLVQMIRRQIEIHGVQNINSMHSLQKEEGSSIEHLYKKKVPILMIFKNPVGVQSIVNYVQAALMHGQVQVRIDAAFTFKYLLDFSESTAIKKEIVKICGALIRVVNDKFSQDLKLQIFLALQLIQLKYADAAKAMVPQLQTTFLKALGDNQTSTHVQQLVQENLILLVKGVTRVDPIIKELAALLDGAKIDGQQKQLVSQCLALIIRAKGKQITSAMSEQVAAQLGDMLQGAVNSGINDIVLVNSGVALSYLSANAADPKQMLKLFDAFPGLTPESIGIKFGVLTNGNESINKQQMAQTLQVQLEDWFQRCSGFDEVNSSAKHDEDNEIFRFRGAFELIGHLTNTFGRREWCQAQNSPYLALIYAAVNKAQTLKQLQTCKEISPESFYLLVSVLSQIPVKGDKLSPDLSEFMNDGFLCVQKFYLEHSELNQRCTDAILNLLQLNYDNFLELSNIRSIDRQTVKEATLAKHLEGVIPDDMRAYAVDIVFKKK